MDHESPDKKNLASQIYPNPNQTQIQPPALQDNNFSNTTANADIGGWNWGAFFWGWVWCIAMRFYIGILLSFTGIIGSIILGIYGNRWAWKHRRFKNIEEFVMVQRVWKIWGFILFVLSVCIVLLLYLGIFNRYGLNFHTINDAIDEQTIRPVNITILTAEELVVVKRVDIKKIVSDNSENKPYSFNIQYTINNTLPQSIRIYQDSPSYEGNNPDLSVIIDQWIGTNNEFLLPDNISQKDIGKIILQDDTQAYTYWNINKLNNSYSYYIFWIKKPLKFVVKAHKEPYDFDITNIDRNIIETKALNLANQVTANSAYLFLAQYQ